MDETTPALAFSGSLEDEQAKIVSVTEVSYNNSNTNAKKSGELDKTPKSNLKNICASNNSSESIGECDKIEVSNDKNSSESNFSQKSIDEHAISLNSNPVKISIFKLENVVNLDAESDKQGFVNRNLCLDDENIIEIDDSSEKADSEAVCHKTDEERSKFAQFRQEVKSVLQQFNVDHYELPPNPKWHQTLKHSLLLPPHGTAAEFSTIILIILTFWITW